MKTRTEKTRPVSDAERRQVRARKLVGHDFALTTDAAGRQRLAAGTAEAERRYEVASGGGAVRVRRVDPLAGITSLTPEQRRAGEAYRDACEASVVGIRGVYFEERVDGGRVGGGDPTGLLGRGQAFRAASRALGHPEIAAVVAGVCVAGHSVKTLAGRTGESRDVVVKLLKIGLDNLVLHFGLATGRRRD